METPFMEVIHFDVENVIATSGGPGPATVHSWDAVNKLLTCPEGYGTKDHYQITAIVDGGEYAAFTRYRDGAGSVVPEPEHTWYFEDATVGNWYVYSGGDFDFMKCNDGQ